MGSLVYQDTLKMMKLIVFALAIAVASATTDANWAVFKYKHGKTYSGDEDIARRWIWHSNLKTIEQHNQLFAQGLSSFYLKENEYADLTNYEFVSQMNGMNITKDFVPSYESGKLRDVPDSVDWRKQGYVTEIKNQGNCGSCWAFSTTGGLEGQHFKSTGKLVSLSESNLVDCSKKEGNQGCKGGLMDQGFQYVIKNGIDTEESYPYKPKTRECEFKKSDVGATETGFKDVEEGSEDALQTAVANIGPISIAIDASHNSFQLYGGGVYNEPRCSSKKLDHGVLAVGYGTEGSKDFWLVKNSWGKTWGLDGYIMMSRNKKNQCGVATSASYPTGVN